MVQENIPVTLITDNMAGYMMAQGEVDAVVVGGRATRLQPHLAEPGQRRVGEEQAGLVATGSLHPGVDDLHAGVGPMADQPQPIGVGEPRRDDPGGPCIQSCRHGISPR